MSYWKNEYDKAIINKDYERAIPIKNRHIPQRLYNYRSFDGKSRWVDWARGYIVHTSPTEFNDPYDCWLTCADDIFDGSVKDGDPHKFIKEHNLVCCFSEAYDSLLMWSHYASSHSGFCIEFDTSKLPYFTPPNSKDIEYCNLYKVVYDNRREFITKEIFADLSKNVFFNPIIIKSPDWKYEKEWRLIVPSAKEEKIIKNNAINAIKTIYFGLETSDENKARVQEIAPKHVAFKEMKMRNDSYELYAE